MQSNTDTLNICIWYLLFYFTDNLSLNKWLSMGLYVIYIFFKIKGH